MHSNFSDGELSPQLLLQHAEQQQVKMLALTDHDTIDGNALAAEAAEQYGIRFIQGVEISSWWQRQTTQKVFSVHIVALDFQYLAPLQQLLVQQKQQRAERALQICEKLQQILKTDFLPDIRQMVDGHDDRITRSHIAQALVKANVVTRPQQAFDRFLKLGKRAYVPFIGVEMAQAIDIIHQSQGFAVLAHPSKYDLSATHIRQMIAYFAQSGGDAVELAPNTTPPATRQMINQEIAQYGLAVSVGSDFHGQHMSWHKLGQVPTLQAGQLPIWHKFRD